MADNMLRKLYSVDSEPSHEALEMVRDACGLTLAQVSETLSTGVHAVVLEYITRIKRVVSASKSTCSTHIVGRKSKQVMHFTG